MQLLTGLKNKFLRSDVKMAELLVVRSKIKDATDCNVAGDFADALSVKVAELVKAAEARCKANNRKTLKGYDL